MQETRAELALLPEPEKVVTFDAVAGVVASLRDAIGVATPEQLKELMSDEPRDGRPPSTP